MEQKTYFPQEISNASYLDHGIEYDLRGSLTLSLVEKWGLVAGKRSDHEDSTQVKLMIKELEMNLSIGEDLWEWCESSIHESRAAANI